MIGSSGREGRAAGAPPSSRLTGSSFCGLLPDKRCDNSLKVVPNVLTSLLFCVKFWRYGSFLVFLNFLMFPPSRTHPLRPTGMLPSLLRKDSQQFAAKTRFSVHIH